MGSVAGKTKQCHCTICGKDYIGSLYKKTESPCPECAGSKEKPKKTIQPQATSGCDLVFAEDEEREANVVSDVCEALNEDYDWKERMINEYKNVPPVLKDMTCPLCGSETHTIRCVKTFYSLIYEYQCDSNTCGAIYSANLPHRTPIRIQKCQPIFKSIDWSGEIKEFAEKVSDSSFEHFITREYEEWKKKNE